LPIYYNQACLFIITKHLFIYNKLFITINFQKFNKLFLYYYSYLSVPFMWPIYIYIYMISTSIWFYRNNVSKIYIKYIKYIIKILKIYILLIKIYTTLKLNIKIYLWFIFICMCVYLYIFLQIYIYSRVIYVCTRARGMTRRNWIFQKSETHLGKVDYMLRAAWWCYRKSSFDGEKWGINGVAEICEYVYRIFARWVFRIYFSIKRFSSWESTTRFGIFRLSVCSEKF